MLLLTQSIATDKIINVKILLMERGFFIIMTKVAEMLKNVKTMSFGSKNGETNLLKISKNCSLFCGPYKTGA